MTTKLASEPIDREAEAITVSQACRLSNLGKTTMYGLISSGRLPTLKVGRKRMIRPTTLRRMLAEMERAASEEKAA